MKTPASTLARAAALQGLLLLALAAIPAAATLAFDLKWKAPAEFKELKPALAQASTGSFVWVDVRNPDRFSAAHVPGAIHFDEADPDVGTQSVRSALTQNQKIVVYGEGTGSDRALRVARLLKSTLPSHRVLLLEGGWAAWPRTPPSQ